MSHKNIKLFFQDIWLYWIGKARNMGNVGILGSCPIHAVFVASLALTSQKSNTLFQRWKYRKYEARFSLKDAKSFQMSHQPHLYVSDHFLLTISVPWDQNIVHKSCLIRKDVVDGSFESFWHPERESGLRFSILSPLEKSVVFLWCAVVLPFLLSKP